MAEPEGSNRDLWKGSERLAASVAEAIAHQLNQPLTAVTNYVRAAQRFLSGDPSPVQIRNARSAMEKAAEQTIRAGIIIRHLRDFVEKSESEKTQENIDDVIREAAATGQGLSRRGNVEVKLDLAGDIPLLWIDKIEIQQVLLNLIRNAVEAMAQTEKPEIRISSARLGNQAEILVRDNGPGLTVEAQSKLFNAFTTTKEDALGIGLTICQSILAAHGGSIRALNERRGAAFEILLPLPDTDARRDQGLR